MVLERARASGELAASAHEGRARIVVRDGRVIAIDAPTVSAPRLGRLLADQGIATDALEHAACARERGVRVGDAMVRAGLAGRGAISIALRSQLRTRMAEIARWGAVDLQLERRVPAPAVHAEPIAVGALMIGAMRGAVADESVASIATRLGGEALVLTPLGHALIDGAALWPDEESICRALRRGATLDVLVGASQGSPRALRLLLALRCLEAVAPPSATASVALLARKARQLRGSSSAAALLDVGPGAAPDEARRAWRRLAGLLHPDRFSHGVPVPLAELSNEVSCALQGAAREMRAL
jgi:hypothetical protein